MPLTNRRFNGIVCLFIILFNFLQIFIWHDLTAQPTMGDAYVYNLESIHPGAEIPSPFMFRQLSPRLVYWINNEFQLGTTLAWGLLTVIALIAAQIVVFFTLRQTLAINRFTSFVAVIILACTFWYSIYNYQNVWLVDPLNALFSAVALWSLLARRYGWFVVTVVVGAINKEAVLLLLPLYPILLMGDGKKWRRQEMVWSVIIIIAVVVAYMLYRRGIITTVNPNRPINPLLGTSGDAFRNLKTAAYAVRTAYGDVFAIYYFIWITVLYGWYKLYQDGSAQSRLSVIGLYWLAVTTVVCFFVTDMPRMYAWLAPIMIVTLAVVINHAREKERIWIIIAVVLYAAMNMHWIPMSVATVLSLLILLVLLPIINSLDTKKIAREAVYFKN